LKRYGNLFSTIISYENLRHAWIKAIRGKRQKPEVVLFSMNVHKNLCRIQNRLESLEPSWGHYRTFLISDPKERIICAASFPERIMHHAIMNVLEPIFERQMVVHTYACRKLKGTQAAVLYAFHQCKSATYFLKMDIRKYFDSIDHTVLKMQVTRLIKDERVLFLLYGITDSYNTLPEKGVPIGNLTSQFFANLYLSGMDHYILETLLTRQVSTSKQTDSA
jgi:RNA-directed DNA polymerase